MAQLKPLNKNRIIVILGPTASGKSNVAIKLAQKFNGEIISADSRQIYRHADLITGKVEPDRPGEIPLKFVLNKFNAGSKKYPVLVSEGIPHYLIDILNINSYWSAGQFQKKAQKIIKDILSRGKLPVICGGTGFWIKALVDNVAFPEVKPDWKLRAQLNKFSAAKLFLKLEKLDPVRAKNIDPQNKVRLIRAIEICQAIGKVPAITCHCEELGVTKQSNSSNLDCHAPSGLAMTNEFLQIGIKIKKEKLHTNIQKRLAMRFKQGMLRETETLHKKYGASWKKLESLGLEFRWISRFLQRKISRQEMEAKLYFDIIHYAKRQMTWFRKDPRIIWLDKYKDIEKTTKKFLY